MARGHQVHNDARRRAAYHTKHTQRHMSHAIALEPFAFDITREETGFPFDITREETGFPFDITREETGFPFDITREVPVRPMPTTLLLGRITTARLVSMLVSLLCWPSNRSRGADHGLCQDGEQNARC